MKNFKRNTQDGNRNIHRKGNVKPKRKGKEMK